VNFKTDLNLLITKFLKLNFTGPFVGENNGKKRRYYDDKLKMSIYCELLSRTDPPVLRRGVSKAVATKFQVPLRLVQSIWRTEPRRHYKFWAGVAFPFGVA